MDRNFVKIQLKGYNKNIMEYDPTKPQVPPAGLNPGSPKKETVRINIPSPEADALLPEKLREWNGIKKLDNRGEGAVKFFDAGGNPKKRFYRDAYGRGRHLMQNFGTSDTDLTGSDIFDDEGNIIERRDKDGNTISKKEPIRINLPPKPIAAPTIKIPGFSEVAAPTPATLSAAAPVAEEGKKLKKFDYVAMDGKGKETRGKARSY